MPARVQEVLPTVDGQAILRVRRVSHAPEQPVEQRDLLRVRGGARRVLHSGMRKVGAVLTRPILFSLAGAPLK